MMPNAVRTRPRLDTCGVLYGRLAAPPSPNRAASGSSAEDRLQLVRRVGLSAARSKRPTASAVAFPTWQRSTIHMAHHVACRVYPAPRKEFTDTARKAARRTYSAGPHAERQPSQHTPRGGRRLTTRAGRPRLQRVHAAPRRPGQPRRPPGPRLLFLAGLRAQPRLVVHFSHAGLAGRLPLLPLLE